MRENMGEAVWGAEEWEGKEELGGTGRGAEGGGGERRGKGGMGGGGGLCRRGERGNEEGGELWKWRRRTARGGREGRGQRAEPHLRRVFGEREVGWEGRRKKVAEEKRERARRRRRMQEMYSRGRWGTSDKSSCDLHQRSRQR